MADRRVRYILEVDYAGESVVLKAADDLRAVDAAATEAGEGLGRAETGFSKMQAATVTAYSALGTVEQGLAAVQNVARITWETLSEGAALMDARGDFADLAEGIGMTADALEGDLSAAASGLMTDAELVGQASELMALNLGLTGEEITTLTGLAAQLDWNWQTLMDTLNTGSTRGLKSLGLNIDEVKAKVAELEGAGMSADQAFVWAIIEAGGEKVERVGKKSEEASGQLEILQNTAANVQDEFARNAAEGFASTLGVIAANASVAGSGMELAAAGVGDFIGQLAGYAIISQFSDDLAYFIERGKEARQAAEDETAAREETARAYQWVIDQYTQFYQEQGYAETQGAALAMGMEDWSGAAGAYAEQLEWTARAAEWVGDAQERARAADYARAQQVAETAAQEEAAAAAAEARAEAITRGGDAFTQFSQGGQEFDFAQALYDAADAAGAGIAPLADLAVQYDLIDQSTANIAARNAQEQAIIDSLAGAAAAGKITWEEYAAAVEHAIDVLDGAYAIDLGPREMPEMEDRGFREGYQENFEPAVNKFEPIPLEVELERESIQAAVDEARGIVEGFTAPETPHEAVVTMNIDEVVEKSGEVETIIQDLPTEKEIRIRLTVTGMDLVNELQSMGVIAP